MPFLAGYRGEQRAELNRFPPGSYPTPWWLGYLHQDLDTLAGGGCRSLRVCNVKTEKVERFFGKSLASLTHLVSSPRVSFC